MRPALRTTTRLLHPKIGPPRSLVHTIAPERSNTMASNQYLEEKLRLLKLDQTPFPNCYPENNPLDVFKSHVANAVAGIVPVDAAKVYGLLQRTKALEHGDLTLPVPALGLKGDKAELAAKLVEQVRPPQRSMSINRISFPNPLLSRESSSIPSTFRSSSGLKPSSSR